MLPIANGNFVFVAVAAPSENASDSLTHSLALPSHPTAIPCSCLPPRAPFRRFIPRRSFRRPLMHRNLSGQASAKVLLSLALFGAVRPAAAGAQKPGPTGDVKITLAG